MMFDIRDYFTDPNRNGNSDLANIDREISTDIDNLLSDRFEELYERDLFKSPAGGIEIIHPRLSYPGNAGLVPGPDKIRYLLSFYPDRKDLDMVQKIVVRPLFVEIGSIELIALYLRKKKILVLYLHGPYFYRVPAGYYSETAELEGQPGLDAVMNERLTGDTVRRQDEAVIHVHPLWYILSTITPGSEDTVEKFFIKKNETGDGIYETLHDISFFFSRHGY